MYILPIVWSYESGDLTSAWEHTELQNVEHVPPKKPLKHNALLFFVSIATNGKPLWKSPKIVH